MSPVVNSERLRIEPMAQEALREKMRTEPDPELRKAYGEMLQAMEALPGREYWGAAWSICLKDGTAVGDLCFKGAPDETGTVELGYGIDEPYRGRGYAAEAAAAVTNWALSRPEVQRVTAQTEPQNAVSQRVLARCGFVPCGRGDEGPLFELRKTC